MEEQLWGVDQLLGVVRSPRLPRAGPWLVSGATILLGHAFFSISPSSTVEVCCILWPHPPNLMGGRELVSPYHTNKEGTLQTPPPPKLSPHECMTLVHPTWLPQLLPHTPTGENTSLPPDSTDYNTPPLTPPTIILVYPPPPLTLPSIILVYPPLP